MVGVGVADGGGGSGDYYGEYYFVPPEMCPHPQQHPQHAHMCTVHADYGGMPVVTSATMMPQLLPPAAVVDENMRHYLVHHAPAPHHPQHHPPHHQPPPIHQPQHMNYGPTNGAGGPQHFYNAGYPAHYHPLPQHHLQHSPPPVYQKDERTQRQYSKLKQKLERKQNNRNNGNIEVNSGASTPCLSPRKELNGRGSGSGGASSGAWSEGEGSSAASLQGDDDADSQALIDMLSATRTPQVSDMTPTSALVQWSSPWAEGAAPTTAAAGIELTYDLLLGDTGRGGYKAIYSGPSLSCRVRDLRPGCQYSVCLRARHGQLEGAPSEPATFTAPAAPPSAPPPPRLVQRARSSLLLRWLAAADNGARLTEYVLHMDAGDGFRELTRPRKAHYTVKNLRPQTRYRFRVAAANECGLGDWSEDAVCWTAGAPPPPPAPPALRLAESRALHLVWERRADEEFTLQMDDAARGHGFLPVHSGPEPHHVAAGLRRATDYRFRLRAETADGQSAWSAEVTYRTAAERPAAPGRPLPRGRVHSRAFRLRWEPPPEDGGAPVTEYTLELDAGDGGGFVCAYRGPERETYCDRLAPGTPYAARVRAANEAGAGDWSPAETVATEASVPGACGAPEVSGDRVRWAPPTCAGGAPLTEYRVELADAAGAVRLAHASPRAECALRGLRPGAPYRLWVLACNRVGAGPPSPTLAFTTPAAPPAAPPAPLADPDGARAARLRWDPPCDNGAPVLDYRLEMSARSADESAFSEVYRGAETQCVVRDLAPFTPYLFRVCALNAAGRGAWSPPRDLLTPRAPPAAPCALTHEATADSLRLMWREPPSYGAEVLTYRVQVGDVSYDTDGPTPERLVSGLSPATPYCVRVWAVSELGEGAPSAPVTVYTRPPPPPPPALRAAHAAHTHLRLEWQALPDAHYTIEMRAHDARDFRPVYRGSARSCKVKKLREATTYEFRIRASDERGGRGPFSEPITAQTLAAPPAAPRAPDVTSTGVRQAIVNWDPLDDATYVLQCARVKDNNVYKQVYEGSESSFLLPELEAGGEYLFRLCYVRGGLAGAWSPPARYSAPAPPAPHKVKKVRAQRLLTTKQAALLMAGGFLVVALVVAVLVARLVDPRP